MKFRDEGYDDIKRIAKGPVLKLIIAVGKERVFRWIASAVNLGKKDKKKENTDGEG